MLVYIRGVRVEFLVREPARDPDHLHHVLDPLGAEAVGMGHLVGQRELLVEAIEVPDARVDVDRLHRVAAREMDAVEVLRELDELLVGLEIPRPLAPVEVPGVGRGRDIAEQHVLSTDGKRAFGVSRHQREFGRRAGDHLLDKGRIEAHRRSLCGATRLLEVADRLVVQELDADLRKDAHRAPMDGGDPLLVQRLGRLVRIDRDAPRHLRDGGDSGPVGMAATAPRAASAARCLVIHGAISLWRHGRSGPAAS
jgi:hypothetical protein